MRDDWNNVHPWNAPPNKDVVVQGGNPKWWSPEWGYNEWNWQKPEPMKNPTLVGDGKQIIIESWPRGFWVDLGVKEEIVNGAVSYGWCNQVSPFGFNWAIETQTEYATRYYKNLPEESKMNSLLEARNIWERYVFPARVKKRFYFDPSKIDKKNVWEIWDNFSQDTKDEMEENDENGVFEKIILAPNESEFEAAKEGLVAYIREYLRTKQNYFVTYDYFVGAMKSDYTLKSEKDRLSDQPSPYKLSTLETIIDAAEVIKHRNAMPSKAAFIDRETATPEENVDYLRSLTPSIPNTFDSMHFFGTPSPLTVPGLTNKLAFDLINNKIDEALWPDNPYFQVNPLFDGNFHPAQGSAEYSNGTDCSGLVTQAIGYQNTIYKNPTAAYGSDGVKMVKRLYSYELASGLGHRLSRGGMYYTVEEAIQHMVPGDYIARTGHVMIVNGVDESWMRVDPKQEMEKIVNQKLACIGIIQASAYPPRNRVGITNMLEVRKEDIKAGKVFNAYVSWRFKMK